MNKKEALELCEKLIIIDNKIGNEYKEKINKFIPKEEALKPENENWCIQLDNLNRETVLRWSKSLVPNPYWNCYATDCNKYYGIKDGLPKCTGNILVHWGKVLTSEQFYAKIGVLPEKKEEIKLIPEKWYKLSNGTDIISGNWIVKYDRIDGNVICPEYIHDGKYIKGNSATHFGRPRYYTFTLIDNSEIQQYLPENHIDRIQAKPELVEGKWYLFDQIGLEDHKWIGKYEKNDQNKLYLFKCKNLDLNTSYNNYQKWGTYSSTRNWRLIDMEEVYKHFPEEKPVEEYIPKPGDKVIVTSWYFNNTIKFPQLGEIMYLGADDKQFNIQLTKDQFNKNGIWSFKKGEFRKAESHEIPIFNNDTLEDRKKELLLEQARKNYPAGTKYKSIYSNSVYTSEGNWIWDKNGIIETSKMCHIFIEKIQQWAEIVENKSQSKFTITPNYVKCIKNRNKNIEKWTVGEIYAVESDGTVKNDNGHKYDQKSHTEFLEYMSGYGVEFESHYEYINDEISQYSPSKKIPSREIKVTIVPWKSSKVELISEENDGLIDTSINRISSVKTQLLEEKTIN